MPAVHNTFTSLTMHLYISLQRNKVCMCYELMQSVCLLEDVQIKLYNFFLLGE